MTGEDPKPSPQADLWLCASRKYRLTRSCKWPHHMLKECPTQSQLAKLNRVPLWFLGFKETSVKAVADHWLMEQRHKIQRV